MTIISKIWKELDEHTALAMEWTGPDTGPWDNDGPLIELQNEIEKTKKTAAGRGLAIALYHLLEPHFDSPTSVVKHAVARYKAKQAGETILTPGLDGVPTPYAATKARETAATKPAQNLAEPAQEKMPVTPDIPEKHISAIRKGIAAGHLDIKEAADMFNLTQKQVKEIVAAAE